MTLTSDEYGNNGISSASGSRGSVQVPVVGEAKGCMSASDTDHDIIVMFPYAPSLSFRAQFPSNVHTFYGLYVVKRFQADALKPGPVASDGWANRYPKLAQIFRFALGRHCNPSTDPLT